MESLNTLRGAVLQLGGSGENRPKDDVIGSLAFSCHRLIQMMDRGAHNEPGRNPSSNRPHRKRGSPEVDPIEPARKGNVQSII